MGFASAYLAKGTLFPSFIDELPADDTGIIVVIPAYDEPGISSCLSSLAACTKPPVGVEVIVIVNAALSAGDTGIRANAKTMEAVRDWQGSAGSPFFRLYVFDAGQPSIRGWGVGTARKTGMDEAVARFSMLNKRYGLIVSLDADCEVEAGYFTALWNDFALNPKAGACSINFRHRDEDEVEVVDPVLVNAVRQYELHLRYFVRALAYSGFPYPFHTVGSALAVKAERYVKAGGMSRRQGGEDFYFIQKLVVSGDFINLNTTTVYPAARLSHRVPFGTGPAISAILKGGGAEYKTYNPLAFGLLKMFFDDFSHEMRVTMPGYGYYSLPQAIRQFIGEEEWLHKVQEIHSNTSDKTGYYKRFFSWFNTFRIVKWLNTVHPVYFNKIPVTVAADKMLGMTGTKCSVDLRELLGTYRIADSC